MVTGDYSKKQIEKKLKVVDIEQDRIDAAFKTGIIKREEYDRANSRLEEKRKSLNDDLLQEEERIKIMSEALGVDEKVAQVESKQKKESPEDISKIINDIKEEDFKIEKNKTAEKLKKEEQKSTPKTEKTEKKNANEEKTSQVKVKEDESQESSERKLKRKKIVEEKALPTKVKEERKREKSGNKTKKESSHSSQKENTKQKNKIIESKLKQNKKNKGSLNKVNKEKLKYTEEQQKRIRKFHFFRTLIFVAMVVVTILIGIYFSGIMNKEDNNNMIDGINIINESIINYDLYYSYTSESSRNAISIACNNSNASFEFFHYPYTNGISLDELLILDVASECAKAQDLFCDMQEVIFDLAKKCIEGECDIRNDILENSNEIFSDGVTKLNFIVCMDNDEIKNEVLSDYRASLEKNIEGLPYIE